MKVTNELIQNATKELIIQNDLDDVNVILLCKYLGIKRQTFYYHYQNIYDVVESIFVDDTKEFFDFNGSLNEFEHKIKDYYLNNKEFLNAVIDSNVKELAKDFYYDVFYHFYLKYSKGNKNETNNARFFAGGASNVMIMALSTLDNKTINNSIDFIFKKINI